MNVLIVVVVLDGRWWRRIVTSLFCIVDEMATWPVRAKADGVESAAQFRFVFRVTDETAKLVKSVSKLTFIAIFARSILLIRPAEFRLVAARIRLLLLIDLLLLLCQLGRSINHRLAVAPVQFAMTTMQLHHQS
jgi:hypothetical protein